MVTSECKTEEVVSDNTRVEYGKFNITDEMKATEMKEYSEEIEPKESDPINAESHKNIEESKNSKDLYERYKVIVKNIIIEPILACYIMPSVLAWMATQNLNLEKACRVNLNYSDEICTALKLRQTENYTMEEEEVQKLIASIQVWKSIVQTGIPFLLILFVGAWSDKTGKRKFCILMPIVGEFLSCIGFIINTYFFYELPVEVTALTEAIFPAITGGWFTMYMGAFSYIGDVTSKEERTFRIGIVNMCMSLGLPTGTALSGVLLRPIGYYGVFSISAVLYIFSLTYGYYYLEEPKRLINSDKFEKIKHKSFFDLLKSFFDIYHVKNTFKVAFKDGPGNRRLRVILLLSVVCVIFGPSQGEFNIFYLFARFRFNWDEVQYSAFSTYSLLVSLAGNLISISLFTNNLKWDDAVLGIISMTSKVLASFVYAFAKTDFVIYMAPLVGILGDTAFIAMRSIATKLVPSEELGKINSLFGLAEVMTPLLYAPLYSSFYMWTLEVLPGAFFLLGAALSLPAFALFGWLYFEHKKDIRRLQNSYAVDADKNCQEFS